MKKLKIFQLTLIVLFLIFIFFLFRSVNYTKEYEVNDVKIIESYNKENDYYYFTFNYDGKKLDYLYESNYKKTRTFIKDITIIKDEDNFCLIPKGNTLKFIPLCIEDNEIIYYKNVSEKLKEQIPNEYLKEDEELNDIYQDINIYNRNYTYLLWNYNGFYYINQDTAKEIKLFDKELYNVNLITYAKDYLIIPDYDNEYTYNKFYRITIKNGTLKEYDLNRDIYFDSYYPGYEKNNLYIVDNKEKEMYELNVKNGELEKIKPKMYNNGTWENVGIKSLINQNKSFNYETNYQYELVAEKLYLTYKKGKMQTLIDSDITNIIRLKDNLVFYLKNDTFYVFEPLTGSSRLLSYFEWNFNNENMIYVD